MTTQKQRLWIKADEDYEGSPRYTLIAADMTSYGWTIVGHVDVEFEIPYFNMRAQKAKAIQAEMDTVRAEFGRRLAELQAALNECLAIEG